MRTDTLRKTRVLAACLALVCLVGAATPAFAEGVDMVATTNVNVITRAAKLEITGVSEDVVGSVAQVHALSLVVQATGQGALVCQWSRTVDGVVDSTFACEGFSCSLADVQPSARYIYIALVSDETGATVSAQVRVYASVAPDEFVNERITYPLLGASIEVNHQRNARFILSVQPVGSAAFSHLRAAASGASLRVPAYTIRVEGQPEGVPAFVGVVRVSIPNPGHVAGARGGEEADGPVDVLLVDEAGTIQHLAGVESGGLVTFETSVLGDFAVLSNKHETIVPAALPSSTDKTPGGAGSTDTLSPTGDAAQRTTLTLVSLACVSLGAILLSQTHRPRPQKPR